MGNTVLVVEDNEINRSLLVMILEETYHVLEAGNGREALEILKDPKNTISAVITDLIMPEMDGYQFLEVYSSSPQFVNIPVIVSTSQSDSESEVKCLEYGAWDFIKKPYNAEIIRFRVKNVIERSELYVLRKLRYQEQFDTLTGIYIQNMFVQQTKKLLRENPDTDFMILHFDISQFQVYNSVFGRREGDKLLCHIADLLRKLEEYEKKITYCRVEADAFCICMPAADSEFIQKMMDEFQKNFRSYQRDYNILANVGVFYIEDRTVSIPAMIDHAKLASKECKGSYIKNYHIYTDQMGKSIEEAQSIVSEMERAMKEEQFVLYLQPKYGLANYNYRSFDEVEIPAAAMDKVIVSNGQIGKIGEKIYMPVEIVPDGEYTNDGLLMREDEKVTVTLQKVKALTAPVQKGQTIGYLSYMVGNKEWKRVCLVTTEDISAVDFQWCVRQVVQKWLFGGSQ